MGGRVATLSTFTLPSSTTGPCVRGGHANAPSIFTTGSANPNVLYRSVTVSSSRAMTCTSAPPLVGAHRVHREARQEHLDVVHEGQVDHLQEAQFGYRN